MGSACPGHARLMFSLPRFPKSGCTGVAMVPALSSNHHRCGSQRYKEQLDWDSESLTRLTLPIRAVSYSPSGLQLVVAGDDGVVKYMTGKTVPRWRLIDPSMQSLVVRP